MGPGAFDFLEMSLLQSGQAESNADRLLVSVGLICANRYYFKKVVSPIMADEAAGGVEARVEYNRAL